MESRVKETIVRHDKGYNCAQAVACTYCDLFGYQVPVAHCQEQCFSQVLKTVMDRSMLRGPKEKHISCPDSCWSVFRSAAVLPSVQS